MNQNQMSAKKQIISLTIFSRITSILTKFSCTVFGSPAVFPVKFLKINGGISHENIL